MDSKVASTYWNRIYIAGDFDKARDVCRQFCYKVGLCVNVTKHAYIYTGGEEDGVMVELINYPRFPVDLDVDRNEIDEKGYHLGVMLKDQLCQDSFLIMTPLSTIWVTSRDEPASSGDET